MEAGWYPTAVGLNLWPLVGRDDELALATYALVRSGSVVLTGAAGVGKTRLAHAVLATAAAKGDRTEWVAATQAAASVPLGCVAHLVPSEATGEGRDATLRAVVAALERGPTTGRVFLGVDDAHLLDDASAALVHLLAMTGTAAVVVTVRSGEPPPDSIVALWKDGQAPLVALQALAQSEVETVVTHALGGAVEGATLHYLWESSRGNALYLRELVHHGIESGGLRCESGLWRWPGRLDAGERLHDLVGRRMGMLDDVERATLELITVGEPLPAAALRFLGVTETAQRLERRGLVASDPRRRETNLAHPLFGEFVRQAMPSTRRDDVRLLLADALEATSADLDADQFRITLWRLDGGDRSRPEALLAAAWHATRLWEPDVAERLARAVLEAGPDFEAGFLVAAALSRRGDSTGAIEAYAGLHELPENDDQLARLAIAEASVRFFHLGQEAEAHGLLADAIARVEDERSLQRLHDEARFLGRPTAAGMTDVEHASALGALGAAIECAGAGRVNLAVCTVDAAFAMHVDELEQSPVLAHFLNVTRTWARLFEGAVAEAEQTATREYTAAVSNRADYPRVSWCMTRGRVALLQGRAREATRVLQEGLVLMGGDDRGMTRPMHAYLAMAAALTGDVEAAREQMRLADEASDAMDRSFGIDVACAHAWVLAGRGELSTAIDASGAAADLAASRSHWMWEALARHDAMRFGSGAAEASRLEELAADVEGSLVATLAMHGRALAEHDGQLLDAASTRLADMALTLFAAEASTAAVRAHRRNGKKASAFASHERALALMEACDFARTPLLATMESVHDLTGREHEVAQLAATNLSSRQIGERLGITTRTVDNLLGRVYTKLDISGRQELSELLETVPRE